MENKPTIKVESVKAPYGNFFTHRVTFGYEHSSEQTVIQLADEQMELLRKHFNAPPPPLNTEQQQMLEARVKQALLPLQQELDRIKQELMAKIADEESKTGSN